MKLKYSNFYEPQPAYEVKDRSPVCFAEIARSWS